MTPSIAGTVVDGANAELRPLASETPRSDDILRVLFQNLTEADFTEALDTSGFAYAVVMVRAVTTPPGSTQDIVPFAVTGPDVDTDAKAAIAGNLVRQIEATVSAAGAFTPGYLIGLLPRFLSFQPAAAMDIDLLVELRKLPAATPGS